MEKTGFIYIWYDRKRKMYYVGCHLGTEDDGYICSSNRMRDAYRRRPLDFKRRILQRDIQSENLLDEEHKWLTLINDNELGTKYYNLRKYKWHWKHGNTVTTREKISKTQIGRKLSEETKKKMSDSRKGKSKSKEYRNKISQSLMGHKAGMTGKTQSEETKRKISEKIKEWHKMRTS